MNDMKSSFVNLYQEDLKIKREISNLTSVIVEEDYELEDMVCERISRLYLKPVKVVEVKCESRLNSNELYELKGGVGYFRAETAKILVPVLWDLE